MIWMDVDTALSEVPVNLLPLIDDGDFKSREESVVYNQAGLDLVWNFVTTGGAMTQTAVTPTTAGVHDWTNQGNGMYSIEIPDTGGTINNDTEGYGWFVGYATGILPWRGPVIGFRAAGLNDKMIDSATDWDDEVQSEVNDALVALKLDHLVAVAESDDPVDDSILAKMAASDGDWSGFDEASDSLEAIADAVDDATVSILAGQSAVLTNSGLVLNTTTIATLASQTSFTLTAGSADDDAYNGCILVIRDSVAPTSICFGKVLDYIGASKTVTLEEDPGIFTFGVGDRACVLAPDAVAAMGDDVIGDDEIDATSVFGLFLSILNQTTGQLDQGSVDSTTDVFFARVTVYVDDDNSTDRYTVKWYKNGEIYSSTATNEKLQVIKDADATDLIAETSLTEVGSLGIYKHAETSNRIVDGATYSAKVTATIEGATRTDIVDVGRDSSA